MISWGLDGRTGSQKETTQRHAEIGMSEARREHQSSGRPESQEQRFRGAYKLKFRDSLGSESKVKSHLQGCWKTGVSVLQNTSHRPVGRGGTLTQGSPFEVAQDSGDECLRGLGFSLSQPMDQGSYSRSFLGSASWYHGCVASVSIIQGESFP